MTIARDELRDATRKTLGEAGLMPDAGQSWQLLAELGWFGLAAPEADGGLGLGAEAVAAVHIELGRALVPGAAIAQMTAIAVLCAAPDLPDRDARIAAAIAGERVALSLDPADATGLRGLVDADLAREVLVVGPDRIALAPIEQATGRPAWDLSRRLFDGTAGAATVIASGEAARAIHDLATRRLLLSLSADAVGGAEAALDMAVDYLKTRRQFDRPLALFQALKHRVADLKIAVAAAEALLWSRAGDEASLVQLGALKALATTTYRRVAEEAVQLHGGIGLTREHPCHLFLKRAFLNAALGGDADHWTAVTAQAALAAPSTADR